MPGKRQEYRSSEMVDPEKSYSIEEEGAARGYYIGLFGIIFMYALGFMFIILLISSQGADSYTFALIVVMASVYIFGWITIRSAGLKQIASYETVGDVLAFGVFFGFVIRVAEGVVWVVSANILGLIVDNGIFGIDHMSPFLDLKNTPFVQELSANNPLMAGGYVIIAISLIVAAVGEEMFYRGSMIYGIAWMTDKKGFGEDVSKFTMLVLQAAIFALLHALVYQQVAQIIALFAGGLIFGILVLWKKDLSVAILAHVTLNMSSMYPVAQDFLIANPIYIVLIIVGVMVFAGIVLARSKGSPDELVRDKKSGKSEYEVK